MKMKKMKMIKLWLLRYTVNSSRNSGSSQGIGLGGLSYDEDGPNFIWLSRIPYFDTLLLLPSISKSSEY